MAAVATKPPFQECPKVCPQGLRASTRSASLWLDWSIQVALSLAGACAQDCAEIGTEAGAEVWIWFDCMKVGVGAGAGAGPTRLDLDLDLETGLTGR